MFLGIKNSCSATETRAGFLLGDTVFKKNTCPQLLVSLSLLYLLLLSGIPCSGLMFPLLSILVLSRNSGPMSPSFRSHEKTHGKTNINLRGIVPLPTPHSSLLSLCPTTSAQKGSVLPSSCVPELKVPEPFQACESHVSALDICRPSGSASPPKIIWMFSLEALQAAQFFTRRAR